MPGMPHNAAQRGLKFTKAKCELGKVLFCCKAGDQKDECMSEFVVYSLYSRCIYVSVNTSLHPS